MKQSITAETVESKIFMIRGHKVMIDRDLAKLYDVSTGALNQAVKRNANRFPEDFMFQLNKAEMEIWISQFVISKSEKMGIRNQPYVFTEQGVAMLSSVLKSERAIQVNIAIMRAFVKLRKFLSQHKELAHQLKELERKVGEHDAQIKAIFQAIHDLMAPLPVKPKGRIGFHV